MEKVVAPVVVVVTELELGLFPLALDAKTRNQYLVPAARSVTVCVNPV